MKMIYGVKDKPKFGQVILFALQQLLAIMAATIAVPSIVGNGMSMTAALFGAGVGTLIYLLFTRFRSPVFLGSSFAFIGSMLTAFAGAVSVQAGYMGLIIGTMFAALTYIIIAAIVKFVGVDWINKLMPAVVIGPTVAIIGLSLSTNAVKDLGTAPAGGSFYIALICGLVTLVVTMLASVFGKGMVKMLPFIFGILAGYALALVFTLIGKNINDPNLLIIDFSILGTISWVPDFTFLTAIKGIREIDSAYIATVAIAYIPVAFVVFAEHIADHKNLSSIIETDLLKDPGLHNTLMGDGVGSFVGAIFGGCPNTTYGESIACVAITRNASTISIFFAAILSIVVSFIGPFATFLATIPNCVMGGICIALYGFIAVSGLKMIQGTDLNENRNLFVVSIILVSGIGGLSVNFGSATLTSIACALILGILTNVMLSKKKGED